MGSSGHLQMRTNHLTQRSFGCQNNIIVSLSDVSGFGAQLIKHARNRDRRLTGHQLAKRGNPHRLGSRAKPRALPITSASSLASKLGESLQKVDKELEGDGEDAEGNALRDVEGLKAEGLLRGFGAASQVPKRQYTLQDLRLHNIDPERLLSPEDRALKTLRDLSQGALAAGFAVAYFGLHWDGSRLLGGAVAILFALSLDQIGNNGGFEALLVDSLRRAVQPQYAKRVALHEAGHFLIAYLVGILPRRYTLSTLDAFRRYRQLNVQAGTQFCDAGFQREVANGSLSSNSLDRFTCLALAGVAAEFVEYGQAEGGMNDVIQLDNLLRTLRFSQKKADDEVRWALLNVVTVLRRHSTTHRQLAEAMSEGKTVGECILVIENSLSKVSSDDI
eukprot:jgi/Botrbrau1/12711/Bobra.67_1s0074.1